MVINYIFFEEEDGIRVSVAFRGLEDEYRRQVTLMWGCFSEAGDADVT